MSFTNKIVFEKSNGAAADCRDRRPSFLPPPNKGLMMTLFEEDGHGHHRRSLIKRYYYGRKSWLRIVVISICSLLVVFQLKLYLEFSYPLHFVRTPYEFRFVMDCQNPDELNEIRNQNSASLSSSSDDLGLGRPVCPVNQFDSLGHGLTMTIFRVVYDPRNHSALIIWHSLYYTHELLQQYADASGFTCHFFDENRHFLYLMQQPPQVTPVNDFDRQMVPVRSCPMNFLHGLNYQLIPAFVKIEFYDFPSSSVRWPMERLNFHRIHEDFSRLAPTPYNIPSTDAIPGNIAVCLPAIFDLDEWVTLIEWIEWLRLMRVDKVFLYYAYSGLLIRKVLEFYAKDDFVEFVSWYLPSYPNPKCWKKCKFTMVNDCMRRTMFRYKWAGTWDMDERPVIRDGQGTLLDIVQDSEYKDHLMLRFSLRIFERYERDSLSLLDEVQDGASGLRHLPMYQFTNASSFGPFTWNVKYLYKPHLVYRVDIHYVEVFQPGYGMEHMTKFINKSDGFMAHYRYMPTWKNDFYQFSLSWGPYSEYSKLQDSPLLQEIAEKVAEIAEDITKSDSTESDS